MYFIVHAAFVRIKLMMMMMMIVRYSVSLISYAGDLFRLRASRTSYWLRSATIEM